MATYKRTNAGKISARPFPGWRTMTRAQRYNAKMDRIFEAAKDTQTRFNESSRTQSPTAVQRTTTGAADVTGDAQ
jgi:hypothetical protein